jgi:general nucleoside transport system permease protein
MAGAAGLLVCVLMSLSAGAGPLDLIGAVWEGAWGSADAAATTIGKLTPLLLTGLAVSMAYQARLLNIGCEGQLMLGALASAAFAVNAKSLPAVLLAPLTLLLGAVAGAMWSYPAVWLKQKRGVHEVITTIFMNYIAIYLCEVLVLGPLGDGTAIGRTHEIAAGAVWQPVWRYGAIGLTAAPFFAVFLGFCAQFWLNRTYWGFEVMVTGCNPESARAAGIEVSRWQRRMFLLSGALAGLAGALEVVAVHHRFYRAFSPGYGFDGITAAFLANVAPGWVWLSGLLLASLRSADKWLQLAVGVSPSSIYIIQAFLLLAVAGRAGIREGLERLVSGLRARGRARAMPKAADE